jgi:tetratricopeptide (TPR) repeat protein
MQPLEQLARRLKGLIIKRPGMALGLWGEAGIGKSHAAAQLARESSSQSFKMHSTTALASLARALPKPKKLPMWAERTLEKLELGEAFSNEQTINAFGAIFSGIAPFMLHLEDVHEASIERLEWIQGLAKMVKRLKGVALLVTSRNEPPEPFEALRLEKLDLEAVKNLLEIEARASLPTEAVEWIHGKAAGNPLFTLEYFRLLARLGVVWNDGRKWRWREPVHDLMPITVEALLEQSLKFTASTPELESVLVAVSIIPRDSSLELFAAVAGLAVDALSHFRTDLRAHGVLAGDEFAHPLYREVIRNRAFETQTYARRALLWCEKHAPELAIEFIEIAQLETPESRALFELAIQRLTEEHCPVEAARLLHRSLKFRQADDRAQSALRALRTLHDVDFTVATELLELALQAPNLEPADVAFLSEQLAQRGCEAEALIFLEHLDEFERTGFGLLEWRIRLCTLAGNTQTALELLDAHPELQDSRQPQVLQRLVHVLATTGRSQEALVVGLRGLELALDVVSCVGLLQSTALAFFHQGQVLDAIDLWSQAIELAQANNLSSSAMKITIYRAQAFMRLGDRTRAESELVLNSKLARDFGEQRIYAQSLIMLGVTLTERTDFERAEEVLLEALSTFVDGRFGDLRLNAEFALTELYHVWQIPHGHFLMHKYANQVLKHAQEFNNPIFTINARLALSAAEQLIGNPSRALELANDALGLARLHGRDFQTMSALRCRANALSSIDKTASIRTWQEAIALADSLNLPLHAQENRLEVDYLRSDLDNARQRLAWFEAHGHTLEANKVRRYFPDLNAKPEQIDHKPHNAPRLELLGSLQISLENVPQTIRGKKRQELLIVLLEAKIAGKSEVTRLELFDALYPDEDENRAASSLKELIRGTRANLGADSIQTTSNGYALGQMTSDVEEFLKTGDSNLWRGAYLQGLEISSLETVRESLGLALQNGIQKLLETDPKEAARVSRFLLEMNPYDLEHLRLSVQAFKASENYKTLGRIYAEARDRFSDVGESLPERWQDFLETKNPNLTPA